VDYACDASYVPPEGAIPVKVGWQVDGACRGLPPARILAVLGSWHRLPLEADTLGPAVYHWLRATTAAVAWPVAPVWVDLPTWSAAEPPQRCPICGAPHVASGPACRGCGTLLPRRAVQHCPTYGLWEEGDLSEPGADMGRERLVPTPLTARYGCGALYVVHGWTRERIPWSGVAGRRVTARRWRRPCRRSNKAGRTNAA
jgi:hypothetical protein